MSKKKPLAVPFVPPAPKTRLNSWMRERLIAFANRIVTCPEEASAEADALVDAQTALGMELAEKWPVKEMRVLARHGYADFNTQLRVQAQLDGQDLDWHWRIGVPLSEARQIPGHNGQDVLRIDKESPTWAAIANWRSAVSAHKAALERKRGLYHSLVWASRHFEQVTEIWPEAEAMRAECGASRTLPAVVDDVTRAAIRADVAARAARQAAAVTP
jgi:hypothetical protein